MKYSYIYIICVIIGIVIFNMYTKRIDGFENNDRKWSSDLIKRFNIYQTTVNNNVTQFNLDQLQRQASPEEAEELLKTGYWPWPKELKKLYIEKVWSSPIIKINPEYAMNYARSIYNKNAVTELLAWNTKEGEFLLYGGNLGVSAGNVNNTLKCENDKMIKKVYTGMNLWNGYMDSKTTVVKPEDVPKEMPGFSFIKGPCNPCAAINESGDFSCPFRLNVNGDDSVSEPWKILWGL